MSVSSHFVNLRPKVSYFHVSIVVTKYFSQKLPIQFILKVCDLGLSTKTLFLNDHNFKLYFCGKLYISSSRFRWKEME